MNAVAQLAAAVVLGLSCFGVLAQNTRELPNYEPKEQLSGTIRIRGDYHQATIMREWESAFARFQPGIRFDDRLTSTAHGIPALVFNLTEIALLGREVAPLENLAFRRMFRYDPTAVAIATGSFDTQYEAYALGIFVNRDNPLTRVTFTQLRSIFGCGTGHDVRTWGQLGLTGEWVDKPIHVFGYPTDNNIAAFFEMKVMQAPAASGPTLPNGALWNCALRQYSNTYDQNDRPIVSSDAGMMRDLAHDRYAIAYAGIHEKTDQVKTLALAASDNEPYVPFTRQSVADRSYPLTRTIYAYINKAPGHPVDPKIREFLKFVLSREGQTCLSNQNVFLPLTATAASDEVQKLQ